MSMRCFVLTVLVLTATSSSTQAMRLTSQYSQSKIFWRMFNPDDHAYAFGFAEGTLEPGHTVEKAHPQGSYQVEIRRGSLQGELLVRAGGIYTSTDDLVFTPNGKLEVLPNTRIAVRGRVDFRYLMNGKDRLEHENLSDVLFVSAKSGKARVSMGPLTIVRDATTTITPGFGTFDWQTGELSLPGHVVVTFGEIPVAEGNITISTGSATSGAKYAGTGTRYNQKTRSMVLVAGGSAAGIEYFVTVTAELPGPTPVPRCPDDRPKCCEPLRNNRCGRCIGSALSCP